MYLYPPEHGADGSAAARGSIVAWVKARDAPSKQSR